MLPPILPGLLLFSWLSQALWMYYIYKLKIDWHIHTHIDSGEKKMRLRPFNWSLSSSMSCRSYSLSCHFQPSLLPKNYWIQPIKQPLLVWNIAWPLKSAEQVKTNQEEVKCSNNAETTRQPIVRSQGSKTKILFENTAALVSFSVWFHTDKKHKISSYP